VTKLSNITNENNVQTEVARLEGEKTGLIESSRKLESELGAASQRIAELEKERAWDTKIADEVATHSALNTDKAKLQGSLRAAETKNSQLNDNLKSLEEKNLILEQTITELQAQSSNGPSRYLVAQGPDAAQDDTKEISNLKELVTLLEEQNNIFQTKLDDLVNDPLEHRLARVQNQVEIYKQLLTLDRFEPGTYHGRLSVEKAAQLHNSGLHRENLEKRYVSPDYYSHSRTHLAKQAEKAKKLAVTPASELSEIKWD
jgi:hypothetical protein